MKIDRHNGSSRRIPSRTAGILLVLACAMGLFGAGVQSVESDSPPTDRSPAANAEPPAASEPPDGEPALAYDFSVRSPVPPSLRTHAATAKTQPTSEMSRAAPANSEAAAREFAEPEKSTANGPTSETIQSRRAADLLIRETMRRLTSGPAFDAKLTQHIWAQGRKVVGVGRYEQAGDETGWFSMEMMIPTANGKCLLQQMSDGRLAWTREQVGDQVQLRRVDVGRLDELVPRQNGGGLRPGLRVGGLVELLQQIHTDYRLVRTAGKVDGRRVWVLRGPLREPVAEAIKEKNGGDAWPALCPREVLVAIAADTNDQGFGKGLPARIEFWSDRPDEVDGETRSVQIAQRNLISLLKIYDARRINPAPQQHFSFETGESDVQFINDTERYVQMFGVKLTAKERVMLLR